MNTSDVTIGVSQERGLIVMLQELTSKLTKVWFRLETVLEKWKRAMAEGFDDPYEDAPRYPYRNKDLAELVRLSGKLGMHYQEGVRTDDSGIKKVVIGVGIALTGAFIIGGWVLSNQVSFLTATVMARFNEQDRRFAEQNERIRQLEQRIQRGPQ